MYPVKAALVLHLYQPPLQNEGVLRQIASQCYLPLIKLIKSTRNHKFVLNIPLSLFELMDKYGYKDWIQDIKSLHESEKIELTGTAAYHGLLTKIDPELAEEQIILNEYGAGYYTGSHRGFEGEASIMVKNIDGFFAPEMAVNNDLVDMLKDLGYRYLLVDETAIPTDFKSNNKYIYKYNNSDFFIVCRNRTISNLISFKRDVAVFDIQKTILEALSASESLVLALDGEQFGHHFSDGIYLLEEILAFLSSQQVYLSSINEILEEHDYSHLNSIVESTWGASDLNMTTGDIYPYWIDPKNKLQNELWKLEELLGSYLKKISFPIYDNDTVSLAVWDQNTISTLLKEGDRDKITLYVMTHKYFHSDKYWWVSGKTVAPSDKKLLDYGYVEKVIEFVRSLESFIDDDKVKQEIVKKTTRIKELLS